MIHELSGHDILEKMIDKLSSTLTLDMTGYCVSDERVWEVLLKAGSENNSITTVSKELLDSAHHNTIRGHLHQRFAASALRDHEAELNEGLMASIPQAMWGKALDIAIDFHDEPSYSKSEQARDHTCGSRARNGTTHFWRIASAYVMKNGQRLTVAVSYVLPDDGTLTVLKRLLQQIKDSRIEVKRLYMDKGFCSTAIIQYLQDQKLSAIIACPIRGKTGGTRALCKGRKSYNTIYTFGDGTTVPVACVRTKPKGKDGKRRLKWLMFVCIGVTWPPKKVKHFYRRRFGIETSYRIARQWRIKTTTSNPALRFFFYGLSYWIINLWVLLCWIFVRHPGTRRIDPTVLTFPCLKGLIRRAIEQLRGTNDSINVFRDPHGAKL